MMKRMGLLRRFLSLVLCLAALVATVIPAAALKQLPEKIRQETMLTARVHLSAKSSSRVIGQLEDGTALTVLDQVGSYYRIDCYEMTGYIAADLVLQQDEDYYVNCQEGHRDVILQDLQTMAEAVAIRDRLLALATAQLGAPYIYGRTAPGGFDCSGLTSYLYRNVDLPITRCADDQMQDGIILDPGSLQIGDLVFFRASWAPWIASHVGIYVGDGMMIHADSAGVRYSPVFTGYYGAIYVGARRIVNTAAITVDVLPAAATQNPMSRSVSGLRTAG